MVIPVASESICSDTYGEVSSDGSRASCQRDAISMALCTRCGQHTEASAEFCAACGGGPERDVYATAGSYQASSSGAGGDRAGGYEPAGGHYGPGGHDPVRGGYDVSDYQQAGYSAPGSDEPGYATAGEYAPRGEDQGGSFLASEMPAWPGEPAVSADQPASGTVSASGDGNPAGFDVFRSHQAGSGQPAPAEPANYPGSLDAAHQGH